MFMEESMAEEVEVGDNFDDDPMFMPLMSI
jgi:hypothetical protein